MVSDILKSYKDKYNKIKLDLACGGSEKNGEDYIGVDISDELETDITLDLNQYPWPFENDSIDEIFCRNYIEHIPHDLNNGNKLDGLIQFMNELYRILKPSGKAVIIAPYCTSIRAYGDPTHLRFISDWTFYYYNKSWRELNKLGHMGITTNFDIIYSYNISEEMSLRSEVVRNKAFLENWNAIDEIIVDLIKR